MDGTGDITGMLRKWRAGDKHALDELMPLVYPRLRAIASSFYQDGRRDATIGTTALVNEAYLRLLQQRRLEWTDREHFYSFSARVMRYILIDYARARNSDKRGGSASHLPLHEEMQWISMEGEDILTLNQALDELDSLDPRKVRLIELRYFLGCTSEEAADVEHLSKASVDRELQVARAWLFRRLKGSPTKTVKED